MDKRIQIPLDLFDLMSEYIEDHYDPDDHDLYSKIMTGIYEKQQARIRHILYTIYRSGRSSAVREMARQEYLDSVGIHEDFRWQEPDGSEL